jgi:hypothetical protein
MNARPFAWYDLFWLVAHRDAITLLDYDSALIYGPPLGWAALLRNLALNQNVFTGVARSSDHGAHLAGQVAFTQGERAAHLRFLLAQDGIEEGALLALLDLLVQQAGGMGAFQVLADVPTEFEDIGSFRRASFRPYAQQRVWRMQTGGPRAKPDGKAGLWEGSLSVGEGAVLSFYQTWVPPTVQSAEPRVGSEGPVLVLQEEGRLLAVADVARGPRGTLLKVVLRPEVDGVEEALQNLAERFAPRGPVYMATRSYQPHLESALERLGAEPGPQQTLLVKYMAALETRDVREAVAVLQNHAVKLYPTSTHCDGTDDRRDGAREEPRVPSQSESQRLKEHTPVAV